MKIIELLENSSFTVEAHFVIREINGETGAATDVYKSWGGGIFDEIPFDVAMQDICYITVVNGYCEMSNEPVMVIEY